MKMSRLFSFMAAALCGASPLSASEDAWAKLDRTLGKEPAYRSAPKYALLVLDKACQVKVWMVEDGKRLFVDKNANGDLTDDGPPIEPSNLRNLNAGRSDFDYLLDAITPADGVRHTQFKLRRWNYGEGETYGLSLSLNDRLPLYAGWFGTFWSEKAEAVPVIHFGGAFTPGMLRMKTFEIGSRPSRLSMGFFSSGSDKGATSRVSIDALPKNMVPKLTIEWPAADGSSPLRTSHELTQRCCYWEFYNTAFTVPANVAPGMAKVSVEFSAVSLPMELTTLEIKVPVVAPGSKLEPAK